MADSIASLPAIPSKSVPGTPFGLNGVKRSGTSPNTADGMGGRMPDVSRAFGKQGNVTFNLGEQPRVSFGQGELI